MQKAPVRNVQTLFCYLATERSRSERSPTKPKHWELAPYGQKSFKTESNRSNRVLCLICCYLIDFSRSDSFSAINFRPLSVAEALGMPDTIFPHSCVCRDVIPWRLRKSLIIHFIRFPLRYIIFNILGNAVHFVTITNNTVMKTCLPCE